MHVCMQSNAMKCTLFDSICDSIDYGTRCYHTVQLSRSLSRHSDPARGRNNDTRRRYTWSARKRYTLKKIPPKMGIHTDDEIEKCNRQPQPQTKNLDTVPRTTPAADYMKSTVLTLGSIIRMLQASIYVLSQVQLRDAHRARMPQCLNLLVWCGATTIRPLRKLVFLSPPPKKENGDWRRRCCRKQQPREAIHHRVKHTLTDFY